MSQLEVDKIVPQSGTTLTIGDSGDTVNFADGTSIGIDTNTLYIDSTNNRVGIGTTSPSTLLDLSSSDNTYQTIQTTSSDKNAITYYKNGDCSVDGVYVGLNANEEMMLWQSENDVMRFGTNNTERMRITSDGSIGIGTPSSSSFNASANQLVIGSSSGNKGLTIFTGTSNVGAIFFADGTSGNTAYRGQINYQHNNDLMTFGVGASEAMRIDSSGNLMVGKTAIALATVGGELRENGQITGTRDGGASLILNRLTSNGEIAQFYKDGAVVGRLSVTSTPGFAIGTPNTLGSGLHLISGAILPSTSTGGTADNSKDLGASSSRFKDLYLGGGAFLGGTGTANKLDDYEEGTWTPDMRGSSGSAGSSSTSGTGTYIKIGKLVFLRGSFLRWSNLGSYSGDAQLFGLPFTASGTDGSKTAGSVCWVKRVEFPASAYNPPGITVENGQNYIEFMKQESNLGVAFELTTTYFDDVLNSFHITCMYETEA